MKRIKEIILALTGYGLAFTLFYGNLAHAALEPDLLQVSDAPATHTTPKGDTTEEPLPNDGIEKPKAPGRVEKLPITRLNQGNTYRLLGIKNRQELEFTLRRDQLATAATLELAFTPSPALISKLSHLRVLLNDEVMGVVPILDAPTGTLQKNSIPLSADYLATYNRISLEFIGHYTENCGDLASSVLWLDVSRQTRVIIHQETLPVANDLAFFPEPFLDLNDMQAQEIPFVFADQPNAEMLEAAATLAAYFGSQAKWRNVSYPVHYDALPDHNAIVFVTNDKRPTVTADYPLVDQPVIDMISAPENPYRKLLIIAGKDTQDLKKAVQALSLGGPSLRGQSVQVDAVIPLTPRKPYDAPNWVSTERPVLFSELVDYTGQLETEGLTPRPIRLNLNLPPDLFVWRSNGIPMNLVYRYTSPTKRDESRLTLSLNDRFVASYPLVPYEERNALTRMHLQVVGNDPVADANSLVVPALRVGSQNQITLDFSFTTTIGNSEPGTCRTQLLPDIRAAVDPNSSIDFSGYAHYLEMPNLRAFANSGFPFSRMADLSETIVVMPLNNSPTQVSTLLSAVSLIGSQTGYPAYGLSVTSDWSKAAEKSADILWVGNIPDEFKNRPDANLLLARTQSIFTTPLRNRRGEQGMRFTQYDPDPGTEGNVRVGLTSAAPIGAIVGMQSPFSPQRSMVGLLGTSDADLELIRDALHDPEKRSAIQGSVVTLRTSGVNGEQVGPTYFVGELKWWEWIWFHLSGKPFLLAGIAVLTTLILAILLWQALRLLARRRLNRDG